MTKIIFLISLVLSAFANDAVHKFAPSSDCKECHPKIYSEYYTSMHSNATPQKDPIHKAVWDVHPKNLKKQQYSCGKCHTPTADNLDKMLKKGEKVLPLKENKTHQEAVSCAYCHRIKDIKLHKKSNTNIITKAEKVYFGTLKNHIACS